MFKKLLSLAAAAMICAGAYAAPGDVVEDYNKDFTGGWNFYVMEYKPVVENGILIIETPRGKWTGEDQSALVWEDNKDEDGDGQPDYSGWFQLFVADGIPTAPGQTYTATLKVKASVEKEIALNMGWGWKDGETINKTITIPTEWTEVSVEYPEVGGSSCNLVAQISGDPVKIECEWVKVTHIDNSKPLEWINVLVNGDAEGDDNSCFWNKIVKSYDGEDPEIEIWNADIETVDGSRVYAFHSTNMLQQVWDSQFFITVPEEYALQSGSDVKISFRYKASKPAKGTTQIHNLPCDYKHWQAIGDINFTTEWQTFNKTLTPSSEMDGGRTIAFNLNELADANDYYFDDIQWCITPTEEGWFVAGDFQDVPWDYDNSVVMTYDDEDEAYVACVGTEEKPASVLRISTKRGNDNAFNTNCIKPGKEIPEADEDGEWEWIGYTTAGAYKISLPSEGIWIVKVDEEYKQVYFEKAGNSGIISIENDANAPAVYYNMQGMQIANPVQGQFYIVKKGNKVSKIIR